ncbi:1-deoxy-D-xylulose-5-phosphate synthase [Clostridium pasteurianum DSM 525 = ATCC 6013]|uniref:1-deoxy-D-xylulose-5-phosphate synthase n=1 Tax=Clostridium pasteurianum DSM 525 = ATCC 6013 TaxID=1262449 RepID=A0A0H3J4R1_CLOPA|nr:1-deoxy-D-xylulose-5-phosphate synthase [Clostridium pasteurianum]AJA47982.1 1-deoxy-D-xylulose-5-phosphate synthase [Clostridium pasteurianum DSM 525 = ATCC 6013]AJA51970.1 1-deoxy-D-xylulose-5-phosphate synthase [Clostridium pasteurianum DSM 525 = ATCC 6013]AOZ75267.1 1-deoxy-D-xylulose-5-phosphate synthase [Clostridium pasteurianum DSM 525 = ATCC 6013]AOZ79062.1 1-deoxy-D-xylulose-5-phosphate synthase [Clostridium pasteurianum]ELP59885.1 1-deoxy-D-xylulose-5-phosphate synthase [Clostridi
MTYILDKYKDIDEIKNMSSEELNIFSQEIRQFLINSVSKTGGHLASNLGVVELTLSLYKVFNFRKDKLIWDVGHQSYVHKILTGRIKYFSKLRKYGGISGFPKREESYFDIFDTGHSSTSISAGLGISRARDLNGDNYEVVSVIGDGALTGGMAYEALNDLGYSKTKMIIILNDNQMSISKNVGGMSKYLNKIRIDPAYNKFKQEVNNTLRKTNIGVGVANSLQKIKDGFKQLFIPGMLFEDMGIKYLGPIDGHNINELVQVLNLAKNIKGPVLVHIITRKGKGYDFAEKNPNKFHGIGPFDCDSGEICSIKGLTYSKVFGKEMINLAKENKKIVAVTAAMPDGTGLNNFAEKFPKRFFDVGIAEQHAVTLCAGMATQGIKPVFAVYSTFLQRAYDQVLHDVCIQKLPVIFAIDRAGIVGEDGETHQGIFDLSYLTQMPNMTVMSPKCIEELVYMLRWAVNDNKGPIAIRYPRGVDNGDIKLKPLKDFFRGKWEIIQKEGNIAIIASGKMVQTAILVKEKLLKLNIKTTIINAQFIKPIDKDIIKRLVNENYKIITLEDNILHGALGSSILEYVNTLECKHNILTLGYKDKFVTQGNVDLLYKLHGLDVEGVFQSILKFI